MQIGEDAHATGPLQPNATVEDEKKPPTGPAQHDPVPGARLPSSDPGKDTDKGAGSKGHAKDKGRDKDERKENKLVCGLCFAKLQAGVKACQVCLSPVRYG
jgi:hypothetical protein